MSDLLIRIAAEFGGLKAAVSGAQKELQKLSAAAEQEGARASRAFERVGRSAGALARPRDAQGRFVGAGGAASGGGSTGTRATASTARSFDAQARSAQAFSTAVGGAFAQVRGLIAALGGLAAFAGFAKLSDDAANLRARLQLVSRSQEDFNGALTRLFDIAQSRGQSFTQTAELYTKLAQATKEAGTSQEALLQVTQAVNDAVALSGATADSANAALIQLGQGLASGTLRGEELNSVLEQTPMLADAIAKGMGITRGELRKYGEEGRITAEAVINALLSQRDVLAQQAETLPATFGRAFARLRNSTVLLVDTFQNAFGRENGLARILSDFGEFLSSDAVVGAVAQLAERIKVAIDQLIGDFRRLADLFRPDGDLSDALPEWARRAAEEFPHLLENIRAFVRIATVEIAAWVESAKVAFGGLADYIKAAFSDETVASVRKRLLAEQAAIDDARKATIADILAERDATLSAARAAGEKAKADRAAARERRGAVSVGQTKAREADAKDRADAEAKLLKDATERSLAQLDTFYDAALITAQDFLAARTRLQLDAIEQQIAVQRRLAAGAKDPGEALRARTEIELLERQKTDVVARAEAERTKIREDAERRTRELRARDLELSGQQLEADRLRIKAHFDGVIKDLERAGDQAGAALARKLVNKELARAEFEDLARQAEAAMTGLRQRLAAIEVDRNAGLISIPQAEEQSLAARQQAIDQLAALAARMRELAAASGDPALVAGVQALDLQIASLGAESAPQLERALASLRASLAQMREQFAQSVADAGVDALTGLFEDLTDSSKSTGEALQDFAANFARSMAQIAARALATAVVLQFLESLFPGIGRLVGASASAGVKHRGGMVGVPGPTRRVDPLMFAAAPRFHGGGLVGIKPGEVPIIAQMGEEVLARNDPRNAANGGAHTGVRIVNAIDPSITHDHMSSSTGERVIVNIIERNRGAIKQILG